MKVKFIITTVCREEVVELPDETTAEDIQEYCNDWMYEYIDAGWERLDD